MPTNFPIIPLPLMRGLNLRDDLNRLGPGQGSIRENVYVNPDGSIELVNGWYSAIVGSNFSGYPSLAFTEFIQWDGTRIVLLGNYTSLYKLNLFGSFFLTVTEILTGITANVPMRFVSFDNYVWGGNGFEENKMIMATFIHKIDRTAVSTADATALASVKTLANALKADMNTHLASTNQHNAADSTNTIGFADLAGGDTQATTDTACNELKTDFNAHRSQAGVHALNDTYHLVEAANATDEATSVTLVNQIKACYNQHIASSQAAKWGITAPGSAPTTADAAIGGNPNGTYQHYYTFYDTINNIESAPSTASTAVTVASSKITVSAMQISSNPNVTHKRIYRTLTSGATFYLLTTVTNATTSYLDNSTDGSIGAATNVSVMDGTGIISPCNIFALHENRIYCSGDYTQPQRVYYTEANNPGRFVPLTNYQDFDIAVTGMASIDNGLLVFESNKTWLWPAPDSPPRLLSSQFGTDSQESITKIGQRFVTFTGKLGAFIADGNSEPVCISVGINKDFITHNLTSAAAVYDPIHDRLFISYAEA